MPEYTQPDAYQFRKQRWEGYEDLEFEKELADLWGLDPWGDD